MWCFIVYVQLVGTECALLHLVHAAGGVITVMCCPASMGSTYFLCCGDPASWKFVSLITIDALVGRSPVDAQCLLDISRGCIQYSDSTPINPVALIPRMFTDDRLGTSCRCSLIPVLSLCNAGLPTLAGDLVDYSRSLLHREWILHFGTQDWARPEDLYVELPTDPAYPLTGVLLVFRFLWRPLFLPCLLLVVLLAL